MPLKAEKVCSAASTPSTPFVTKFTVFLTVSLTHIYFGAGWVRMAKAGPVFSPVVARRPTRVSAAATSAGFLLLLAALVLANSSGRRGPFRASVEESAAAWARAQSAKNVALAKHMQVASSGPKTAPADPANLTPAARSHAQSRITGLKAEVEAEQQKASRLDATVSDEAAMIRDALLKAKKMQREAARARTKAVERRLQVSPCFARLGRHALLAFPHDRQSRNRLGGVRKRRYASY